MPTYHGYARVSTKEQAEEGMSLEVQAARIRAYFDVMYAPKGYTWGGIFTEPGISAELTFTSREVGGRLNNRAHAGDVIAVLRLDRGFRSLLDCAGTVEKWWDRGVFFCSITEGFDFSTPHGKLMMQIIAALAEFERYMIGQRIKEAWAARRARGVRGCTPVPRLLEWNEDGTELIPFEPERSIATKIVEWRDGGSTFDAIAHHLMVHGILKPAKGRFPKRPRWTSADVIRLYYTELKLRYFLIHGWKLEATEFYYMTGDRRVSEGRSPLQDRDFWTFWHESGEPNLEAAYPDHPKIDHPYRPVVPGRETGPGPSVPGADSVLPVPSEPSDPEQALSIIRRRLGSGAGRSKFSDPSHPDEASDSGA